MCFLLFLIFAFCCRGNITSAYVGLSIKCMMTICARTTSVRRKIRDLTGIRDLTLSRHTKVKSRTWTQIRDLTRATVQVQRPGRRRIVSQGWDPLIRNHWYEKMRPQEPLESHKPHGNPLEALFEGVAKSRMTLSIDRPGKGIERGLRTRG